MQPVIFFLLFFLQSWLSNASGLYIILCFYTFHINYDHEMYSLCDMLKISPVDDTH